MKLPLTAKVEQLTNREAVYLAELQSFTFENLIVPTVRKEGRAIMISNVRPKNPLNNDVLTPTHLSALTELYTKTTETHYLQSTDVWQSIQQDLQLISTVQPINNLSINRIEVIKKQLIQLAARFDETELMPLSIAHGDLTPWNTFLSQDKLHIYDWELAERLPLLYDVFHYIFQTSVLVQRLPYKNIKKQLTTLEKTPIIQSILINYDVQFRQLYQFYLLRTISYYLARYSRQAQLHNQVFWLMDSWEAALLDIKDSYLKDIF